MNDKPGIREQARQRTHDALVKAARALFAEKGYHATGTHEIVAAAGVSRGALQHHFPRKEDLFLAVFHAVERDLMAPPPDTGPAIAEPAGWESFRRSIHAFLASAATPEVQRILLIDGPAVLGWAEWRRLEAQYGLGTVCAAVEQGIAVGAIRAQAAEPLSHLILAAIDEAALMVANARFPDQAIADARLALDTLLDSLT